MVEKLSISQEHSQWTEVIVCGRVGMVIVVGQRVQIFAH